MDFCGPDRPSESQFAAHVEYLSTVLDHADRAASFRAYYIGLMLPGDIAKSAKET